MCGSKVLFLIKKPAGIEELFQRKPAFLIPLPEFRFGWVLLLDVAGHVWNSFRVKLFLGFLASGAFGVAKKDHGGSPPVIGYLRVSPLEVLYAIAVWKTMGFAAILRSSAFLPQQNRFADPVGNQFPVTGGVVFQQRLHHLRKLFPGKRGDFQLLTIQIFHSTNLPVEVVWKGRVFAWGIKDLGMISRGLYMTLERSRAPWSKIGQ